MFTESATHRGAAFAGRRRELGLLAHLLERGLRRSIGLVRVTGESGVGRRRLIGEALNRGPDAEWIQLAPGGVEPDLKRWAGAELPDLLETYPHAPYPSWALHVLSEKHHRLSRYARVPRCGPEWIPDRDENEGAAVAAVLRALTAETLVLVDAGLWPSAGSSLERKLDAIARGLAAPGSLMITAGSPPDIPHTDPDHVLTLTLDPLRRADLDELVRETIEDPDSDLADWLYRVSGGRPFYVFEILRWLEESGHVRIDDEHRNISMVRTTDRLPLPLSLRSVLDARYRRLTPEAARLLHLLQVHNGTLEFESLRTHDNTEEEVFEEGMAVLRRRGFLLHRTKRRPVALASPLWDPVIQDGVREFSRYSHPAAREPEPTARVPRTPLSRARMELLALRGESARDRVRAGLAELHRVARRRPGPSWIGVRGRVAILAGHLAVRDGRNTAALCWVARGLSELGRKRYPGLRRSLERNWCAALEQLDCCQEADRVRRVAYLESLEAGHLVAATHLAAAIAEGKRRLGFLAEAEQRAATLEPVLGGMGQTMFAELAGFTYVSSLLDQHKLDAADTALEERGIDDDSPRWSALFRRAQMLRNQFPTPILNPELEPPRGWGWGLDHSTLWENPVADRLQKAGYRTLLADLALQAVWSRPRDDGALSRERDLRTAVASIRSLDAPERMRHLAGSLRETPLAETRAYRRELYPELLTPVRPSTPLLEPVRILLTGNPRVDRSDGSWPIPFWPEWWTRLWILVLSAEVSKKTLSVTRLISGLGDLELPSRNPGTLVGEFNRQLRGAARIDGGLLVRGDVVRVDWNRLECDLHDFLTGWEEIRTLEPSVETCDELLRKLHGDLLPGLDNGGADELRRTLSVQAAALLELRLSRHPHPEVETRVHWKETLSGILDLDAILNRFTTTGGDDPDP